MKISIIGDSFAADIGPTSWVSLLSNDHTVTNYSQRGISEYRLYKIIEQNLADIQKADYVIIFHTNPDRVYVPDTTALPSRSLGSHPKCDMVANDIMSNSKWSTIAETYYKYFFDTEYQEDVYRLMFNQINTMLTGQAIVHCSGFTDTANLGLHSFASIREQHPGTTNHLDDKGNFLLYNYISEHLK